MVGKLMKHEMAALFRIILFVGIAGLALSIVTRLLFAIDPESFGTYMLMLLSVYLLLGLILASYCVSIAHFSRSLFTGQGYMTFSLPATTTEILIAKLLSALILMIFSAVVAFAGFLILMTAMSAESLALVYQLLQSIGVYFSSEPLLIVESIISIIVSLPTFLLFCYLAASIGQLATKGRKWISFGIALGVVVLLSLLSGVIAPLTARIMLTSVHLYMWLSILLNVAINVAMFFGTRYILKHKLNLLV